MVQPLNYSHPVLSIKVGIVPFPSKFFESGTKSPCVVNQSKAKSVLHLESPPKTYPYVGGMIHICSQNETCRQKESRRTEM